MPTTVPDEESKLVVKHYCALGTEPVFKARVASADRMKIERCHDLRKHSYARWAINDKYSDANACFYVLVYTAARH